MGSVLQTATGKLDLKEPYYRISQASLAWTQEQPMVQQAQQQQLQQPGQGQGQGQGQQAQGAALGLGLGLGVDPPGASVVEGLTLPAQGQGMDDDRAQQQALQQQVSHYCCSD